MPLYYKPTLVQGTQLQWGDVGEPHRVVLRRNDWLPTKSTIEIYLQVTFDIRNVIENDKIHVFLPISLNNIGNLLHKLIRSKNHSKEIVHLVPRK